MRIAKYGRHWAVYARDGALICVCLDKKGALEVVRVLLQLPAKALLGLFGMVVLHLRLTVQRPYARKLGVQLDGPFERPPPADAPDPCRPPVNLVWRTEALCQAPWTTSGAALVGNRTSRT